MPVMARVRRDERELRHVVPGHVSGELGVGPAPHLGPWVGRRLSAPGPDHEAPEANHRRDLINDVLHGRALDIAEDAAEHQDVDRDDISERRRVARVGAAHLDAIQPGTSRRRERPVGQQVVELDRDSGDTVTVDSRAQHRDDVTRVASTQGEQAGVGCVQAIEDP